MAWYETEPFLHLRYVFRAGTNRYIEQTHSSSVRGLSSMSYVISNVSAIRKVTKKKKGKSEVYQYIDPSFVWFIPPRDKPEVHSQSEAAEHGYPWWTLEWTQNVEIGIAIVPHLVLAYILSSSFFYCSPFLCNSPLLPLCYMCETFFLPVFNVFVKFLDENACLWFCT